MRGRLIVFIIALVSLVFGLLVARRMVQSRGLPREQFAERTLRLLTYSTFVGSSGPGGEILKRFERENGCKVKVTSTSESGLLLERLKFGQNGAPFDVVLGLNQLLLEDARSRFEWEKVAMDKRDWFEAPSIESDDVFVPFDWAPLSFIYRQDEKPVPRTFDGLLISDYGKQFALQDPRTSATGLQFYKWAKALKGRGTADWLRRFKPNVNSISPGWAFSYGMFNRKETRFVFTYVTSLAYHWGVDNDRSFQVLSFPDGHPVEVEFAAVPKTCRECDLGKRLVRVLLDEWAQQLLMKKNFMFPVRKGIEKGTLFEELPTVKTLPTPGGKDLSDWDQVFPR